MPSKVLHTDRSSNLDHLDEVHDGNFPRTDNRLTARYHSQGRDLGDRDDSARRVFFLQCLGDPRAGKLVLGSQLIRDPSLRSKNHWPS